MSWPWPRVKQECSSLLTLAGHELRMTLRERAGWVGGIAASALAFVDAAFQPHLPIVGGIRASTFGGPLILTPLAIVYVAGAARRDESVATADVVGSRPYLGYRLSLARLLGQFGLTLLLYAIVVVCSLLPSLIFGGKLASPLTAIHAFVRGIVPLLYIAALTYCAVALARNVLAAAVVAVYWLFVQLWGDFLARIFNFALTQNWPTYAAVGLAIVLGTLAIQRRIERAPRGRRAAVLPISAVVLLLVGVGDAWNRVAHSHDKPLHQDAVLLLMAAQHLDSSPRLPGFWLPDQRGRGFSLSETNGRVAVVGFWSPHLPGSAAVLERLRDLSAEFPPEQVMCVAVALANDHALSPHAASEGRYRFPMVTDVGTHYAGRVEECSPIAEACMVTEAPSLFVTDRARRVVARFGPQEVTGIGSGLADTVRRALTIPAPPFVE